MVPFGLALFHRAAAAAAAAGVLRFSGAAVRHCTLKILNESLHTFQFRIGAALGKPANSERKSAAGK